MQSIKPVPYPISREIIMKVNHTVPNHLFWYKYFFFENHNSFINSSEFSFKYSEIFGAAHLQVFLKPFLTYLQSPRDHEVLKIKTSSANDFTLFFKSFVEWLIYVRKGEGPKIEPNSFRSTTQNACKWLKLIPINHIMFWSKLQFLLPRSAKCFRYVLRAHFGSHEIDYSEN